MKFSLIICTYMRAKPLVRLLDSVALQRRYPDEILIVDGSPDNETSAAIAESDYDNIIYHKVPPEHRGLTRQRNYGIAHAAKDSEVICFLDDDTVLEEDYFENVIAAFQRNPDAIGVGGISINESRWKPNVGNRKPGLRTLVIDGYVLRESSRNVVRKLLGLGADHPPGVMPEFSHGNTYSYPPTGEDYPVDLIIGMAMNFRRKLFDHVAFSTYFEGYGLYEDADMSIRALDFGQNYIATSARLYHFHDSAGRPNKFRYGKMVVRNGWYVWRLKFADPSLKARFKWHATTLLLALIRLLNVVSTSKRKEALTESAGRIAGWFSLFNNPPRP